MRFGVLDFFSGCGGASTGFSLASIPGINIEIVAGVDNDKNSCLTYTKMHGRPAYCLDIKELVDNPTQLESLAREWKLEKFDKTIFIGCAPCQGFAAHRKAIKGDDPRRHLFSIFAELVKQLQPDGVFMENVPDIFSKKHWPYYSAGREILQKENYMVKSQIYNFAGFGLPQERFRAVMLALKRPFEMPEAPFTPGQFSTVRDAIGHLPPLKVGEVCHTDSMHRTSNHRKSTIDILSRVPHDGGNRPIGVGPVCLDRAREKHGGYTDVYGRLAWDRPSVTITARCRTPSCGRFAHPEQNRGLSIREAALLQGFPADFIFEGNFDDKFKQIGNAVPPIVAKQFAEHLVCLLIGMKPPLKISTEPDIVTPVGSGFAVTINGIKRKREAGDQGVAIGA